MNCAAGGGTVGVSAGGGDMTAGMAGNAADGVGVPLGSAGVDGAANGETGSAAGSGTGWEAGSAGRMLASGATGGDAVGGVCAGAGPEGWAGQARGMADWGCSADCAGVGAGAGAGVFSSGR